MSAVCMLEYLETRVLLSATVGDASGRPLPTGSVGPSASVFLSISTGTSTYGEAVDLVAHVVPSGVASADGLLVDFVDQEGTSSAVIGTETVVNGIASLSWGAGLVGTHSITATIEAGQTIGVAASAPQTLTISQGSTLTVLTVGDGSVTAKVTVGGAGGVAVTSGSVSFFEGTNVLGTVALSSDGSAVFSTSGFGAGTHVVVGAYNGSTQLLPSTSAGVSVSVAGAPAQPTVTVAHGGGGFAAPSLITWLNDSSSTGSGAGSVGSSFSISGDDVFLDVHKVKFEVGHGVAVLPVGVWHGGL